MAGFQFMRQPPTANDLLLSMGRRRDFYGYLNLDCLSCGKFSRDINRGAFQILAKLWTDKNILDTRCLGDDQFDILPDAEMDHTRAKIPPISHTALKGPDEAGFSNLRLFMRPSLNDDHQHGSLAKVQPVTN